MSTTVRQQHQNLMQLQRASPAIRKRMIETLQEDTVHAVTTLAQMIVNRQIPILRRDREKFRDKRNALRQLASMLVSVRRKRATLLRHDSLVPFLLRPFYINCHKTRER